MWGVRLTENRMSSKVKSLFLIRLATVKSSETAGTIQTERRIILSSCLSDFVSALTRFMLALGVVIGGCSLVTDVGELSLNGVNKEVQKVEANIDAVAHRLNELDNVAAALSNRVYGISVFSADNLLDKATFEKAMERRCRCPWCCCK